MIEREFIVQKTKEFYIRKYIETRLRGVGISSVRLKKIPLGEKIIIATSRPSIIVGSKGSNIRELTRTLKTKFKLENPQIEINEVKDLFLDAQIVAQRIANSLERFGSARFKSVGHRAMANVVGAGALGVELVISGKIPGSRAKNWRFYQGYLKKCGDIAITGVRSAQRSARLKSGVVGIKVSIMPPGLILPDHVEILSEPKIVVEESEVEEKKPAKKSTTKKKTTKKKASKPKKDKADSKEAVEPKKVAVEVKVEAKEEVAQAETEAKADVEAGVEAAKADVDEKEKVSKPEEVQSES